MSQSIDYATHPNFNPDAELTEDYAAAVRRLSAAFAKDDADKNPLLTQAREALEKYTARRCREIFGLGSKFSLAKEFFYETISTNAGAVARVLALQDRVDEAKGFLLGLYRQAYDEGFDRKREFLANRIDSRTFMPMRRYIDRAYLEAIGLRHLDRVLLCVGDCQTHLLAERIRDALPLDGIDIASYMHGLGSLLDSPLASLLEPVGYFYWVNAAADYAILGRRTDQREKHLDVARQVVAYLRQKQPRISLFVTHVFFGVDNVVEYVKTPREVAMDAVSGFSDDVAAILSEAPNARLINFQEICPFTLDKSVFRDNPTSQNLLHIRFDIMDRVTERVVAAVRDLRA